MAEVTAALPDTSSCARALHFAVLHPLACRAWHARRGRHARTASSRVLHPLCQTRPHPNKTARARPTRGAAHVTRGRQAGRGCPAPADNACTPLAAPHPPATLHRLHWSARAGSRAGSRGTGAGAPPPQNSPGRTRPGSRSHRACPRCGAPPTAGAQQRPAGAVRRCASRASYFIYHSGDRFSAPCMRLFARADGPCACYFRRPAQTPPMPACMQAPCAGL